MSAKYIVDLIGSVVDSMRIDETPYYMYGHPLEVINTLTEYEKHPKMKLMKYPLIVLFQDFEEAKGRHQGIDSDVSLNLIICTNTLAKYKSAERYELNFKPVLYPLYDLFLEKLASCGYFSGTLGNFQHTKIDRMYWGKNGLYASEGNIFNDRLDAIEIKNLELSVLNKSNNCKKCTIN